MKKSIIMTSILSVFFLTGTIAVNAQCSGSKTTTSYNAAKKELPNIITIAVEGEDFSTLVAAVQAAELVETIRTAEAITLFAPTNAAFDKIPSETLNSLLMDENKEQLQGVLTYHVVAGKIDAATLIAKINDNEGVYEIKTLSGKSLYAYLDGEKVILKDGYGNLSTITATDIEGSNGYVHVIDTVVLPK